MIDVNLQGFDEYRAKMNYLSGGGKDELINKILQCYESFRAEMIKNSPVESGKLRSNFSSETKGNKYLIHNTAKSKKGAKPYPLYVNSGHRYYKRINGVKKTLWLTGQHFVQNAYNNEMLRNAVNEKVKKIIKDL